MRLTELHALVPAAEAHDLLGEPDLDAPRQESLFPDEPEPDVADWDEPLEDEAPPLTHAQAVALVQHVLGGHPA